MRGPARLRSALTLVVVFVVALEFVHWVQPLDVASRSGPVPALMVAPDGTTWFRRLEAKEVVRPGEAYATAFDYDEDGRLLRETEIKPGVDVTVGGVRPSAFERWWDSAPWKRFGRLMEDRFDEGSSDWVDALLGELNASQRRAPWHRSAAELSGGLKVTISRMPLDWSFRDGRFVCINPKSKAVVGSFGPDGYADGDVGASVARFDHALTRPAKYRVTENDDGVTTSSTLVDGARSAVVFVSFDSLDPRDKGVAPDDVPIAVRVTSVPVTGPQGEVPTPLPKRTEPLLLGFRKFVAPMDASDGMKLVFVRAGGDLVAVRREGIVHRARMDPEEVEFQRWNTNGGNAAVVTTILPPIDPARPRMRIRMWREDGTLVVKDARAPLISGGAAVREFLGHKPMLLRPPLLVAVSFAAPGPADFDEYSDRWLLDPDVAGGSGVGLLAASLVVAAVCGVLARRVARTHCPAPREVAFWTAAGAALGVVGLVWMWIVVARSHVAACACGRRRAVHVATCPACSADWPTPAPTGIEVFAPST